MNVNTTSNLAMMSSMVGITQQIGQTKTANGDLAPDKQVNETDMQESSRDVKKEQTPSQQADIKSRNALRSQAQSIQRRYVPDELTQEEAARNDAGVNLQGNDAPQQKQTRYLDTSRQIQYSFGSFKGEAQEEQAAAPKNPLMKAETERKNLVENLRKWVDLELKQYVKQNQPIYPRKDLRDILNTLGSKSEQDNQRIKMDSDAKESTDKPTKYNIGNISKITRTMRYFEDIPSENLFEDVM
jgi:hypothetical protein